MRRRRLALLAIASLTALVVAFAGKARAEDDEPDLYYDWSTMKLAADHLPEGWKLIQGASDLGGDQRLALHEGITESGKEAANDPQMGDAFLQSIDVGDGKVATVALVDVKSKAQAFLKALKPRAEKAAWALREMGAPARLLLVAAPEDVKARVVAVQSTWAARMLATSAVERFDEHLANRAEPLAKAALAIEPGAARAHMALGLVKKDMLGQGSAPEAWDAVIAEFRAATDEKAAIPLSERETAQTRGELGLALLERKNANEEARDVLAKSVAGGALIDPQNALINRYNLACAHGRLKEIDPAFEQLKTTLEDNKKVHFQGLDWQNDHDFDNLHGDPRWEELKKSFPKPSGGD